MDSAKLNADQVAAVNYVNTLFSDEFPSASALRSVYDAVLSDNERIKLQLDKQVLAVTQDAPIHIEQSLKDLDSAAVLIQKFKSDEDQIVGDVCNSVADMLPLVTKLSETTAHIRELEKYSRYLSCIAHVEDLSSDIQSALLIRANERAVDQFNAMVEFARAMQDTKCLHLLTFVRSTVTFWYKILLEKLCSKFDETLKAWQWPFIPVTVKVPVIPKASEVREEMGSCFQHLVCLHVPNQLLTEKVTSPFSVAMPSESCTLLLPMQVLLKPFQTRFNYHFFTNDKTSRSDKPEWYFTQTLTWIHDHEDFLKTRIQPEFDKAGLQHINALMEFTRGLVVLIMRKMSHDIELMTSDSLLAHLIDETLAFHRELRCRYHYPDALPGCLRVLQYPDPFRRWLTIEKKYALEKMDAMLTSDTRWQCQYRNIIDVDESKVSECGETFMTLLSTITDRYRWLPSLHHQLQFVQLQLELLDDYRVRLVQIRSELQSHGTSPISLENCSILNTVKYIIGILQQWTDQPFFGKLHYYKQQTVNKARRGNEVTASQSGESTHDADNGKNRLDESITGTSTNQEELLLLDDEDLLDRMDISLFDEVINLLQLLQDAMLGDIESYVYDDVRARSKPYRCEKWLSSPSQKDFLSLALSNSACEMMQVLKDHLHQMELLLSKPLFNLFWQSLATSLNRFIYKQLILANHFNEGGAAQLQFDMTRNLFPLFGAYTAKPENFFKDVKESCLVLSLSAGSALLLRDVLHTALHRTRDAAPPTDPIAALHDIGVYKLELEEVEYLLSRRADINV